MKFILVFVMFLTVLAGCLPNDRKITEPEPPIGCTGAINSFIVVLGPPDSSGFDTNADGGTKSQWFRWECKGVMVSFQWGPAINGCYVGSLTFEIDKTICP